MGGGGSAYRHSLGLGKSFGFGQISLTLDAAKSRLLPNHPQTAVLGFAAYRTQFTDYMDKQFNPSFKNTIQIRSLLAMANPQQRQLFKGQLKHLLLMRSNGQNTNQFLEAKQQGLVLAPYV